MAYDIILADGSGTKAIENGTYTLSFRDTKNYGFSTSTIKQKDASDNQITFTNEVTSATLTVDAVGTYKFYVRESAGGTGVAGAEFERCVSSTNRTVIKTKDNSVFTSASDGLVTLTHIPYVETEDVTPLTLYFIQTKEATDHAMYTGVIEVISKAAQQDGNEVINLPQLSRTVTLYEDFYPTSKVAEGTITLT